jgi:hypothetical protein
MLRVVSAVVDGAELYSGTEAVNCSKLGIQSNCEWFASNPVIVELRK